MHQEWTKNQQGIMQPRQRDVLFYHINNSKGHDQRYKISDDFDNKIEVDMNRKLDDTLIHASLFDGGDRKSQKDDQNVLNLIMLKDTKPTKDEKVEVFKQDHRKLISYIQELDKGLSKPLPNIYQKQKCLHDETLQSMMQ